MNTATTLTDLTTLTRRRARSQREALFLHDQAADEVQDRLAMVNKSFTAPALVSDFPALWSEYLPDMPVHPASEVLPLEPLSHDLVVHAMSLHWANDPVGQLIQCRRTLRPDGMFLAVSYGGQTLHELRACLAEAEVAITGGLSPRVAPMAELRDMGGLLQRAGFALPVADAATVTVEYADVWHLMRDLRAMGEGNALAGRLRMPTQRAVFERAAALYHQNFATPDGRIPATFEMIFLTGWAPDESQQKPLRPGSAQQRLADALGTDETKLRN